MNTQMWDWKKCNWFRDTSKGRVYSIAKIVQISTWEINRNSNSSSKGKKSTIEKYYIDRDLIGRTSDAGAPKHFVKESYITLQQNTAFPVSCKSRTATRVWTPSVSVGNTSPRWKLKNRGNVSIIGISNTELKLIGITYESLACSIQPWWDYRWEIARTHAELPLAYQGKLHQRYILRIPNEN